MLQFHGKRDWTACRRAWQHSVDPKLNQDKMKPEEEQRLASLIKETNGSNWVYIAQQLGVSETGRQPANPTHCHIPGSHNADV